MVFPGLRSSGLSIKVESSGPRPAERFLNGFDLDRSSSGLGWPSMSATGASRDRANHARRNIERHRERFERRRRYQGNDLSPLVPNLPWQDRPVMVEQVRAPDDLHIGRALGTVQEQRNIGIGNGQGLGLDPSIDVGREQDGALDRGEQSRSNASRVLGAR